MTIEEARQAMEAKTPVWFKRGNTWKTGVLVGIYNSGAADVETWDGRVHETWTSSLRKTKGGKV